jgi:hypothetical protein
MTPSLTQKTTSRLRNVTYERPRNSTREPEEKTSASFATARGASDKPIEATSGQGLPMARLASMPRATAHWRAAKPATSESSRTDAWKLPTTRRVAGQYCTIVMPTTATTSTARRPRAPNNPCATAGTLG